MVFDLFDDTDGAVTIPKVIGQFHVLERPCTTPISELVATNTTNEVDQALTDYAIVTYAEPVASTNADGTFAKKTWVAKEKITTAELNRMEEGISDVSSQCKDIAKRINDITTTGFSMIDVSSEDTYSVDTSSSGGGTGETTVSVTGITITGNKTSIKVGETLQLTANITPSNATNKNVEWTSTVINYATVSNSGLVKAMSEGDVTIEATTEDGQFVARYNISITANTSENKGLIFELNSDNYTSNSTTWTDSIGNIPCTLSAGVTKDETKGLQFTGVENATIDISSLNISKNTQSTTFEVEFTPTDTSGTFGMVSDFDILKVEYRGYVTKTLVSYLTQNRVSVGTSNINETHRVVGTYGEYINIVGDTGVIAENKGNTNSSTDILSNIILTTSYIGYIKAIKIYNKIFTFDELKTMAGYTE